jgi:hypothetical protein
MDTDKNDDVMVTYSLRIPKGLAGHAKTYKHQHSGLSLNTIFVAAIERYLSPTEIDAREAALARRLEHIDRRLVTLGRHHEVISQGLAVFIKAWLTNTSEVPADQQKTARVMGERRWKIFLEVLSGDVEKGKSLFTSLPDSVLQVDNTKKIPTKDALDQQQ